MSAQDQQPYIDPQTLRDVDTYVYEAIATLEYQGGTVVYDQVLSVTDLDERTVRESLRRLTERRVLLQSETGDGPRYQLARRDWSVTPDIPEH